MQFFRIDQCPLSSEAVRTGQSSLSLLFRSQPFHPGETKILQIGAILVVLLRDHYTQRRRCEAVRSLRGRARASHEPGKRAQIRVKSQHHTT